MTGRDAESTSSLDPNYKGNISNHCTLGFDDGPIIEGQTHRSVFLFLSEHDL